MGSEPADADELRGACGGGDVVRALEVLLADCALYEEAEVWIGRCG